jgi:hypothetical protein
MRVDLLAISQQRQPSNLLSCRRSAILRHAKWTCVLGAAGRVQQLLHTWLQQRPRLSNINRSPPQCLGVEACICVRHPLTLVVCRLVEYVGSVIPLGSPPPIASLGKHLGVRLTSANHSRR